MNSLNKNLNLNFLFLILNASINKNPKMENAKFMRPEIKNVSGTKTLKVTSLRKIIFIKRAEDAKRKIKVPFRLS